MDEDITTSGKLPGKTLYAGRRRPMTRKSGYSSHPDFTGRELKVIGIPTFNLKNRQTLKITFILPKHNEGQYVGFGGWFSTPPNEMALNNPNYDRYVLKFSPQPDWGKVGSMWVSNGNTHNIEFTITAREDCNIALWEMECGIISHEYIEQARPVLLKNMYEFSPEAHFYKSKGNVAITIDGKQTVSNNEPIKLFLKSCNRCGRFLPINIQNERLHLSFTNHCTASHKIPCSHATFGKLIDVDTNEMLQLQNGYQLECRYCKKYAVNAALNPQRTAGQMKEDGTRRRAIELLLSELYQDSLQMSYRHEAGSELANDIWERFNRKCFNCGKDLESPREMQLDHTRPLALMWPLDRSATALCKSCNSDKRDRPPSEFYSVEQLKVLSEITGVPYKDLEDPSPNMEAIGLLLGRLDWFFDEFLKNDRMTREFDGKIPADLLIKALQKTLEKCPGGAPVNLESERENR